MNTDKQIDKLHDDLRDILDPDDCGWINKSTEVVIDDLIMAGVSVDEYKTRFEVERIVKRDLGRKLAKAEHDRDRYAIKIKELETENEKWREMWADNQRQWESAYDKLEAENAEQDEAILRALKHMGECRREGIAECSAKILEKLSLHFGTYTSKDKVEVAEVFRLINQFTKEVLEGK